MTLRLARADDLPVLLEWIRGDFFANFAPGFPPPDAGLLQSYVAEPIARGAVLLAESAGDYSGSLALMRGTFGWSREVHLAERWFHVRSDRRGSRAAVQLRAAAIAMAGELGLPFYLGDLSGTDALRKARWHERAGGRLLGAMFRFLPPQNATQDARDGTGR